MPRKRNTLYESMTWLQLGPWTIRIWRTEKTLFEALNPDRRKLLADIQLMTHREELTAEMILSEIGCMENVAAVEVLNPAGNGGLIYPDWK